MSEPLALDDVVALYDTWGRHRYDEAVTQLDHALQTAALAVAAGATDELVAAALLHDVGHLLHLASIGDDAVTTTADLVHEQVGADALGSIFPDAVTEPIRLHVAAKRYRCATDPNEVDLLSEGSRRSLRRQGGPMSVDEVAAFRSTAHSADAVALRAWDDAGKDTDLADVAPFDSYLELLERLAVSA